MLDLTPLGLTGDTDAALVDRLRTAFVSPSAPRCRRLKKQICTSEQFVRKPTARHFIEAADWFFRAKQYPEILWAQVSCNKLHFAAFDVSIAAS